MAEAGKDDCSYFSQVKTIGKQRRQMNRTTSGFPVMKERLAQHGPCWLVEILHVELPLIRLQVFHDLLHCAEARHSFSQHLQTLQRRGQHRWGRRLQNFLDSRQERVFIF